MTVTEPERFMLRAAVYLLPRENGKVLMSLRQNTGFGDGQYGIVGGHLDGNENARAAMVREAREEAGLDIRESDLIPRLVMHRASSGKHTEAIDIFFDLPHWTGDIVNTEPHKCQALEFYAPDALPENTIPYIRAAIEAIERGETYIEFGF